MNGRLLEHGRIVYEDVPSLQYAEEIARALGARLVRHMDGDEIVEAE